MRVAHGRLPFAMDRELSAREKDRVHAPHPPWHGSLRAMLHRGVRAEWHIWFGMG